MSNIKLLLIGKFSELKTEFNNRITKYKKYIICTGEVRNPIPYIRESDIFVCYSELECFVRKLLFLLMFSEYANNLLMDMMHSCLMLMIRINAINTLKNL